MKVSISWLKELVDHELSTDDLANELSLNSIGVKQQTEDYLELDLTYNRGDLLSMRGVAYEVAAITNSPLRFLSQTPEDFVWVGQNLPKTPVEIENSEFSQVQCVAKIENLKIGESSKDVVKKLEECGMRSVDNITDVTNLVMLEYGQPLHSFDASTIEDETIKVRGAKTGEGITTLDNKLRKLTAEDIVLADTQKPLDVAGVMGGKDTEIKESTHTILVSASMFNPIMVRKTSKRLGLYSEASKRFQHGLSPIRLLQALDAAIRMYQDLGGKLTAINLVGDFSQPKMSVNLSIKRTNDLLGLNLDEETITSCLKKLSFVVNKIDLDTLEVIPPYFRLDINIEEDLIEEVARMYGYSKIDGIKLIGEKIPTLDETLPNFIYDLKTKLKEIGLTEVHSYSFYSTSVLEVLGFTNLKNYSLSEKVYTENKKYLIRIANPISSETEYLRMDLWPNLLEVIGRNIKQGFKDIAVFEIGKAYFKDKDEKPTENYRLSIALMNGEDNPIEGLSSLFQKLSSSLKDLKLIKATPPKVVANLFHPTRFVSIEEKDKQIAGIAEVHLRLLNKLGIDKRVAVLEMNLSDLIN